MKDNTFIQWLTTYFGSSDFQLKALAGDASFRQYFRVWFKDKTFIAMDAHAEKDKCPQFVAIAEALKKEGLNAPDIFAKDFEKGFLLLSDLGDDLFLKKVSLDNADLFYKKALDALKILSRTPRNLNGYSVPDFTEPFMQEELFLFQEWFLEKYLKLNLSLEHKNTLAKAFKLIAKKCHQQKQVFMHRDFHSANLMILPNHEIGILDFQDAFIGPYTYDLVSLLKDCYISWPKEKILQWMTYYSVNIEDFNWMALQRHLKALLTFSRKFVRDQNENYLQHIPRTWGYVLDEVQMFPELTELKTFFEKILIPSSLRRRAKSSRRGMILAAGRGERMGHLTEKTPKALLRVNNRYLIEYSIQALKTNGINEIVINVSYLADQIKNALGNGSHYGVEILYSDEPEPLETGGGVFQALPMLGDQPFIVLSCDVISDYPLQKLPVTPDKLAHLVLVDNPDFHPQGDFVLRGNQILTGPGKTFTFGNIGVYTQELFKDCKPGKFRLGDLLKNAIQAAKVTGESYHGFWQNFGTPLQLENTVELPNTLL